MTLDFSRPAANATTDWRAYPLLDALHNRRSRRVGLGAQVPGPLAYDSPHPPVPLTEEEEAILAFAACGITGSALCDLDLAPDGQGTMMSGVLGRTVASLDAIQTVIVAVINDESTYLLRRPADLAPSEVPEAQAGSAARDYLGLSSRMRVPLRRGRTRPPEEAEQNISLNRWGLHARGSTYFLPIGDLTYAAINVLLEFLGEQSGWFLLDERRQFRPAGLGPFGRRKGGHLDDDPVSGKIATIEAFERAISEMVMVEEGMILQNLGLACEALGLGGYPNYAGTDTAWLEALGFRMADMPTSRFLGVGAPLRAVLRLRRQDLPQRYALGLDDVDGNAVLLSYAPPYFPSMRAAVEGVVERKFGEGGIYRQRAAEGAWRDPESVAAGIQTISDAAVEATVAYCEYVFHHYGRFPAYSSAFRAVCGFQAQHLDVEFYDRYYRAEVLRDAHREHLASALHTEPRSEETPRGTR